MVILLAGEYSYHGGEMVAEAAGGSCPKPKPNPNPEKEHQGEVAGEAAGGS